MSAVAERLGPRIDGMTTADEIDAMSDSEHKAYENRLRRLAQRQGLSLKKSRRRDLRVYDWGTYMLVDIQTNTVVACGSQRGYGLRLHEIEECLTD